MAGEPGVHTVIVARDGEVDPARDAELLRGVEAELGLPPESLSRPDDMDRPEYRLMEGISAATAERLAGVAVELGYTPRVRDRVGITMSSERALPLGWGAMIPAQGLFFVGVMAVSSLVAVLSVFLLPPNWALVALAVTVLGLLAATGAGVALSFAGIGVGVRQLQKSLYMPLILDRATLPEPIAEVEGSPIAAAVAEARDALKQLRRVVEADAPEIARADLLRTHAELMERVTELQRQASGLVLERSPAVDALEERLTQLADDGSEGERALLLTALDDEADAVDEARGRLGATLTELLGVRRSVLQAVADLQADDPERDPTAGLRAQVSALRSAGHETRDRALRARGARGGLQRQ